jgi:hypothetical protein
MSDEQTTQATEDTSAAAADDTAGTSRTQDQTDSQSQAGSGESDKANESGTGKPDASTAGSGDNEQSQQTDSQASQPSKVRRSSNRFKALADENTEYRKLYGPLDTKKPQPEQQTEDNQSNDSATGSKLDPADKARLDRVERNNSLVLQQAKDSEDSAEIAEFFSGDHASERKEFEPKIREMWKKPQYKDLSASDLYAILNHATAGTKAVETYKKAQKEARENATGGNNSSTNRRGGTTATMTDAELIEHNQKVISGRA